MSSGRLQHIRSLFVERLASVAEEMFREVESAMESYAEENKRLRSILQMVLRPEIKLSKIDVCQYTGRRIDVLGQLPQQNTGVDPETTEPPLKRPKEEYVECKITQISEQQQTTVAEWTRDEELTSLELQRTSQFIKSPSKSENFDDYLQKPKLEFPSVRLIQVNYGQQQKYVKLDGLEGQLSFIQFHEKVVRRFSLPPNAMVVYKDATGTEVDAEVFSDLVEQGDVSLTVFSDLGFQGCSSTAASEAAVSGSKSRPPTVTVNNAVCKRRVCPTLSPKEMIEAALRDTAAGQKALKQYQTTGTLTSATRRQMVKILVAHMMTDHGHFPNKKIPEKYALGIVTLFPSLKDPYTAKGYEQYYDSANNTGYLSWRLKTVQRKVCKGFALSESCSADLAPGGPELQSTEIVESKPDVDALQEALSLLNRSADKSLIFQKMRDTFQHRQKIINDADRSVDILYIFPRFLDTKGLVDQDFTLLFDDDTSSRLLGRWNEFKPKVIKEAKLLPETPELRSLLWSAENSPRSDDSTSYDQEMASLLLLIYLLPPRPGRRPKGSARVTVCDAIKRLIVFHKSCSNLEEHLHNPQGRQPYLLAVGAQKNTIESFYIVVDKHLIPCHADHSLGALDELFKVHFVFNLAYDVALKNFYTFLQTAVYKINAGRRKESLRVRKLRTRMLHQLLALSKRRDLLPVSETVSKASAAITHQT